MSKDRKQKNKLDVFRSMKLREYQYLFVYLQWVPDEKKTTGIIHHHRMC